MTAPAPSYDKQPGQGNTTQRADSGAFAKAVRNGIDNEFIQWAEQFGKRIANPRDYGQKDSDKVTTSQIRNIYGTVKKLEMNAELNLPAILLLKPRIAYATARNKGLGDLAQVITKAIDVISQGRDDAQKQEYFQRFCKGFEAILAYHRAAGGK